MQRDFHHAVVFVLARAAGFTEQEAAVIAYSSQYVDDAVHSGFIKFREQPFYYRLCTAHGLADAKNLDDQANQFAWLPFHFLPGYQAEGPPELGFVTRLICRADSEIAREMIAECIRRRELEHGLHRLGITLHVYADTWAHQNFTGMKSKLNVVHFLKDKGEGRGRVDTLWEFGRNVGREIISEMMDCYALGHAAASTYPDLPYAVWEYRNFAGTYQYRVNSEIFMDAVDHIYAALCRYRLGNVTAPVGLLADTVRNKMEALFTGIQDTDPAVRHLLWLQAIADDAFGLGATTLTYAPQGPGSWKEAALGELAARETLETLYEYRPEFEHSDWKLFHDAAKEHWRFVMEDLLVRYGLLRPL